MKNAQWSNRTKDEPDFEEWLAAASFEEKDKKLNNLFDHAEDLQHRSRKVNHQRLAIILSLVKDADSKKVKRRLEQIIKDVEGNDFITRLVKHYWKGAAKSIISRNKKMIQDAYNLGSSPEQFIEKIEKTTIKGLTEKTPKRKDSSSSPLRSSEATPSRLRNLARSYIARREPEPTFLPKHLREVGKEGVIYFKILPDGRLQTITTTNKGLTQEALQAIGLILYKIANS